MDVLLKPEVKKQGYALIGLLAVTAILAIAAVFFFQGRETAQETAPTAMQKPTEAPTATQVGDEELVRELFEETWPSFFTELAPDETMKVVNIEVEGAWAKVETTAIDAETGEFTVGEGTIVLFRRLEGQWEVAYSGSSTYKEWLDDVPETLISPELKIFLE